MLSKELIKLFSAMDLTGIDRTTWFNGEREQFLMTFSKSLQNAKTSTDNAFYLVFLSMKSGGSKVTGPESGTNGEERIS